MKAILVSDSTPTEKGSYSLQGSGVAICSPCCGNTFYTEELIRDRNQLTAGPFPCPACLSKFSVVGGEITFTTVAPQHIGDIEESEEHDQA